jgi:mannose-6-phosphate isomerase-like protein (cupin superfamily)
VTILSGEVDLVLDRESVRLASGDCVVQCGAPRAWRAVGPDGCVLGVLRMAVTTGGRGPTPVGPRRSAGDQGVGPRRVVTSRDGDGRSFVVQDGEPPNVLRLTHGAGMAYSDVWQTLGPVHTPEAGGDAPAGPFEFYALGGGAAWKHMVIPPDATLAGVDAERLAAEYAERAPGMAEGGYHDPERPGRHRTDSIDLLQILSGRITLVLDEDEVDLAPGDFVVQRGTWHAWSNRTDEPCVFQAMMISTGPLAG